MTLLDLILILVILAFVLAGLWFGLIHSLGAVIGTVAGVAVAGHYAVPWGAAAKGFFLGNENLARVVIFFIVAVLVNRLIGVVFWIIEKIFKFVSIIPFMKTFEKLLGGALGFVEGVIVVGGALYLAARFPISASFASALAASTFGLWLVKIFGLFAPLLPEILRNIKNVSA
jgi:uncharacterized membrane protein required for colicin V production